jgi:hypothetical protein
MITYCMNFSYVIGHEHMRVLVFWCGTVKCSTLYKVDKLQLIMLLAGSSVFGLNTPLDNVWDWERIWETAVDAINTKVFLTNDEYFPLNSQACYTNVLQSTPKCYTWFINVYTHT